MGSIWTLVVLVVLWLIVVVPMIVRRSDERQQERSVAGFGRAMRALTRRHVVAGRAPSEQVFVAGTQRPAAGRSGQPKTSPARRPVPAPQEALMYPVDRNEMSAARAQMMKRRRRSLSILVGGSVLTLLLAATVGGGMFWGAATAFLVGLSGYVYFLRTQALRDRERRQNRLERAVARREESHQAYADEPAFAEVAHTVVAIDDDDIRLHNMDTVDLTGLYSEEAASAPAAQRRAS